MQTKKSSIIRTYAAGVHVGEITSREDLQSGLKVTLKNARRIWYWNGAASLSQLAVHGISAGRENNCKFPCEVETIELMQVIEIIPITKNAADSINSIPVWEK